MHGAESKVLLKCPRMDSRSRPDDHSRKGPSWIVLLGVLALWLAARIVHPTPAGAVLHGYWLPACPLRGLTGIPCPFCGITTGCSWLVRGHFREAWHSNILSPFLMFGSLVLGAYVLIVRLTAGRAPITPLRAGPRRVLWMVVGAAIAASWIVNLIRR